MTAAVPLVAPTVPWTQAVEPPPPPPRGEAVGFTGSGGAFLRLLVRGSLLQLPTFGFYRFWLTTEVRRHLWSATRVGQDAFDYTGTARELLLGFLMALAILSPAYIASFLLGTMAEGAKAFSSVPVAAALYLFGHYAVFRARRYRATRTVFRGLRFWMTGSGWAYLARAAAWDVLTVLTLGLAYPWRVASLERYLMRHTRYGDLPGSFAGRGLDLFRRGMLLWIVAVPVPIAALVQTAPRNSGVALLAWGTVGVALALLPALLVYPLFRATVLRWRLEGVRFGEIGVRCTLPKGPVVRLYGMWALLSLVYGAVAFGLAAALSLTFLADLKAVEAGDLDLKAITAIGAVVLTYTVAMLGFMVLKRHFLDRGLWRLAALSLTVTNLHMLDHVSAAGAPASGIGEGLTDALDFGG